MKKTANESKFVDDSSVHRFTKKRPPRHDLHKMKIDDPDIEIDKTDMQLNALDEEISKEAGTSISYLSSLVRKGRIVIVEGPTEYGGMEKFEFLGLCGSRSGKSNYIAIRPVGKSKTFEPTIFLLPRSVFMGKYEYVPSLSNRMVRVGDLDGVLLDREYVNTTGPFTNSIFAPTNQFSFKTTLDESASPYKRSLENPEFFADPQEPDFFEDKIKPIKNLFKETK